MILVRGSLHDPSSPHGYKTWFTPCSTTAERKVGVDRTVSRLKKVQMNGEMDASTKDQVWTQDDLLNLLEAMKVNLPQKDLAKYKTSESHLDWEKVAFNSFTGEMCKQKWNEVSKVIRKFRTLTELIFDAQDFIKNPYKGKKLKKHPDFPKKPLTPYFRFFIEKRAKYAKLHPEMSNLDLTKILSMKYRGLPDKKKVRSRERVGRKRCN
ncbi:nucleolar transcription factor 1 isoform X2 [Salmo salar]|uniref:Nucleolar transcription factor 1 isoform X2 n=2 Tax=Salmo salar TaxID=8030 RepID=A0ABM3EEI8_SALSA|nr:nucleolar transcription factor 1-like isoform X2 [Salmo salar]